MDAQQRKVAEAIKEVRSHLNESQQEFSNRLGVTLSTVARYESVKPPKGPILVRIAEIARASGRDDLADILRQAEETQSTSRISPIAGAVRQLRASLACTQSQLAELAAVAVSTVARAETNTLPDTTVLKKFAGLARQHNLIDIAQIFEQAQVPNFFASPEELRRIELKRQLLTAIDTLDSYRLNAIETILRPATWPDVVVPVDDVPPPPWEFDESGERRDLTAQALAMLQAARGSTGVLDERQSEEGQALCATAWLLGYDEASEELIDFLIEGIQRVLEQRGSGLSETELEAFGLIGARASTVEHILLVARQLRVRIDSASAGNDEGPNGTLTLMNVIRRERARSSTTAEQFAESLGITTEQLNSYESGEAAPGLRTLALLKSRIFVSMRPAEPSSSGAYSRELAVILEAVFRELAKVARRKEN